MRLIDSRASTVLALATVVLACGSGSQGDAARRAPAAPARRGVRALAVPGAGVRGEIADELLVRYRPSANAQRRLSVRTRIGGALVREFGSSAGLVHLRVPAGSGGRALQRLRQDPDVLYAEPNFVVHALAIPDDPRFPDQWALHNTGQSGGTAGDDIHAPEAWELTTGSRNTVVAVVDSGVDTTHPDLAANLFRNEADCNGDGLDDDGDGYVDDCHGVDVTGRPGDPIDEDGHGTMVAGIIGAVGGNGIGVTGVAWQVGILPCRFLDGAGDGTTAGAIACLDYVASIKDRGVDVIAANASWGSFFYSQALAEAVEALRRRGILLVTASGNDGQFSNASFETFPCALTSPNVLCVSASTADDLRAEFSNDGPQTVDLSAPGVDILTTLPLAQGGYGMANGTSFAAPHVTGTLALLHAYIPGADWRELKNRILAGATPLAGEAEVRLTVTDARLDAYGALTCRDHTVTARLTPNTHQWLSKYSQDRRLVPAGVPMRLSALHIDCGAPAGEVTVQVEPGGATIVLRDDGLAPDAAAADGIYTAEWTPAASGTYTLTFPGNDVLTVDADADLVPGFPVRAWQEPGSWRAGPNNLALVGDIDGLPGLEILVGGISRGPLFAFHSDGTPVPGWPVLDAGYGAYPALAKLSPGTPGMQVVAGYDRGGAAAWDGMGNMLPGWPIDLDPTIFEHRLAPTVSDVNGDGLDESLIGLLRRADGTNLFVSSVGATAAANSPALADLLGDGEVEFVTAGERVGDPTPTGGQWLRAERYDGTLLAGFPVEFHGFANTYPVVGDVDGDGQLEIALVGMIQEGVSGVLVYDRGGGLKRALPLGQEIFWGSAPALADLDGDGVPEIVVQTDSALNVLRGDGSSYGDWAEPQLFWAQDSAPMVGDVDGDGYPEIVVTQSHGLFEVYDRHGNLLPGFPKQLPLGSNAASAIADLDGDGRNEIVIAAGYSGQYVGDGKAWSATEGTTGNVERVWVYRLGGQRHGPVQWGQFMGNAQHTGTAAPSRAARRTFHRLTVSLPASSDIIGDVLSQPDAIWCPVAICARDFPEGTTVTLTGRATEGYEIWRWEGACTGTGKTCTVRMDQDRSVSLVIGPVRPALTVTFTGSGAGRVTSTPAGVDCTSTCTVPFELGTTTITLHATAAAGAYFVEWSGMNCPLRGDCVLPLSSGTQAAAEFEPLVALSVTLAGEGHGTVISTPAGISCGATCSAEIVPGSGVDLSAAPAPGSRFAGWTPALCSEQSPTCHLSPREDTAITATFEPTEGGGGGGGGGGGCSTAGTGAPGSLLLVLTLWMAMRPSPRRRSAPHHAP